MAESAVKIFLLKENKSVTYFDFRLLFFPKNNFLTHLINDQDKKYERNRITEKKKTIYKNQQYEI